MTPLFRQKAVLVMGRLVKDFPINVSDAAAIVGNLGHESGGFATLQEIKPTVAGSKGGYGWAQWTGPRRRAFEAWCKTAGLKPSSDDANYGYLRLELKGEYSDAIMLTVAAKSLADKVKAFEKAYEKADVKNYASRNKYAADALEAWLADNHTEPTEDPEDTTYYPPLNPEVKTATETKVAIGASGAGLVAAIAAALNGLPLWAWGLLGVLCLGVIGAVVLAHLRKK